jgi:hypothetical protein
MKFNHTIFGLVAVALAALATTSCIKEPSVSNEEREQISLDAWIALHKPELKANYQENGGYYVEKLEGDKNEMLPINGNNLGSEPIMDQDTCWVFTRMTGRDINGTICLTRSYEYAQLCGTFSHSTHYVPYVNYGGSTNMGLLEGSYLAMRNELKLGDLTYKMRRGSHVRLYLPSSIAYGESGSQAEGGYEGQYGLDASRPLILDIEVLDVVKNPSDLELEMVRDYIGYEGKWTQAEKSESEKTDEDDDLKLKGLYYNLNYNPETDDVTTYKYMQPHTMIDGNKLNSPYTDNRLYMDGNMAAVTDSINKILLKRFGKGIPREEQGENTQVTKSGRANVWYVVRFLDGFVLDTNIAEIRQYLFDEDTPTCEVFSYSPSDDDGKEAENRQAIGAWYYCIPQMHHGAYGQIVTTSGYAYGASGISGTTSTEESSSSSTSLNYYNAMNYYNYYNSYYNYYSPYYNYYDYSYYNYNYNVSEEEIVTTTTISTEILPYTPLVFTLYVEPYE